MEIPLSHRALSLKMRMKNLMWPICENDKKRKNHNNKFLLHQLDLGGNMLMILTCQESSVTLQSMNKLGTNLYLAWWCCGQALWNSPITPKLQGRAGKERSAITYLLTYLLPHLHLHHHCPREFVVEYQTMFALTKFGLLDLTSVATANSKLHNQFSHHSVWECDVHLCFTEEQNCCKSDHLA